MTLRSDVSVLYVDPRGPYPKLVADWYDEARDARTYAGPWPVVAHPPCGPWGSLAARCKRLDEAPLALHALAMVRRYGGVLEHPRGSRLWQAADLPPPRRSPMRSVVEQSTSSNADGDTRVASRHGCMSSASR